MQASQHWPDHFTITLANRGGQRFRVDRRRSILDALEAESVSLPYGCRYGGCISCAAKILSGEVNQSAGVALNPRQIAEGYVLLCVARPLSDCVFEIGVESHDSLYRNPFKDPTLAERQAAGMLPAPRPLEQEP
jgi:ferredoxin